MLDSNHRKPTPEKIALDFATSEPEDFLLHRQVKQMSPARVNAAKHWFVSVRTYIRAAFATPDLESKEWFITMARAMNAAHNYPFGFRAAVMPGQLLQKPAIFGLEQFDRAMRDLPLDRMRECQICKAPFFSHRGRQCCSDECSVRARNNAKQKSWKAHGKQWRAKRTRKVDVSC